MYPSEHEGDVTYAEQYRPVIVKAKADPFICRCCLARSHDRSFFKLFDLRRNRAPLCKACHKAGRVRREKRAIGVRKYEKIALLRAAHGKRSRTL